MLQHLQLGDALAEDTVGNVSACGTVSHTHCFTIVAPSAKTLTMMNDASQASLHS